MTADMICLSLVLLGAVTMFITELFRIDIIALIAMLSLAWLGIITPAEAMSGFSSNAVLSVIGVMIIGLGVERSGLIGKIADPMLKAAGHHENRLRALLSLSAGSISAFLPNIGAAALLLPVSRRLARKTGLHPSRLLMPMGFAVLMGGTATMVGSGPMILLNDVLNHAGIQPFNLFGSTPLGLTLLGAGIVFFLGWGQKLLPRRPPAPEPKNPQQKLIETFNLEMKVYLFTVTAESPLAGKTREEAELWNRYRLRLLAIADGGDITHAPWRGARFHAGQELALSGCGEDAERFRSDFNLAPCCNSGNFKCIMDPLSAGFAEIIIMPGAHITGKTFRQISFRKSYDLEPVMMIRGDSERRGNFADIALKPGDIIIAYGSWEKISRLKQNEDFTVPTPVEQPKGAEDKARLAGLILAATLTGVILGVNLPLMLLSGALAMMITGTAPVDDAYRAVDWRTVFLMAGLIPMGLAMEKTGAAVLLSAQISAWFAGSHGIVLLLVIGALSTLFSLFISNVAATVLLAPLAINIARSAGLDPAGAALLAAVCTANSFLLPTNQVNAFLMAPGEYTTRDYLRIGAPLTLLFLITATLFVWFFI